MTSGSLRIAPFFLALSILSVAQSDRTPVLNEQGALPMLQLSFANVVTYESGEYNASSVAIADVNGDGKPDIVVANQSSSSVGVLLGNGDGTFQAAMTYNSGNYSDYSVAVADVNGDGKPDIIVANFCTSSQYCTSGLGSVGVLLGNGDGTFQAPVSYASGGDQAVSVAVADVNGDGKPDIIVANNCISGNGDECTDATGAVGVLLGNGDGAFRAAVTFGSGSDLAVSIAVADVNGDGKPDLLVANYCASLSSGSCSNQNGSVGVLLGNGDGTFQTAVTYSSGFDTVSVAVADVNGDGALDLLTAGACSTEELCVSVLLGNGDGTFRTAVPYGSDNDIVRSVAVADVNGDGAPDLLNVGHVQHHRQLCDRIAGQRQWNLPDSGCLRLGRLPGRHVNRDGGPKRRWQARLGGG